MELPIFLLLTLSVNLKDWDTPSKFCQILGWMEAMGRQPRL
jgi:hypothetical protein